VGEKRDFIEHPMPSFSCGASAAYGNGGIIANGIYYLIIISDKMESA
jgi:hypothetical protein